jgi:hypothetical protein
VRTRLYAIAHGRSGDKGDTVNVGVIARRPEFYDFIRELLTVERVQAHFGAMVRGGVERYELPNLHALNFLMHEALGGGGTVSLMTDAQGKTFSTAMLRMDIDLPEDLAKLVEPRHAEAAGSSGQAGGSRPTAASTGHAGGASGAAGRGNA